FSAGSADFESSPAGIESSAVAFFADSSATLFGATTKIETTNSIAHIMMYRVIAGPSITRYPSQPDMTLQLNLSRDWRIHYNRGSTGSDSSASTANTHS